MIEQILLRSDSFAGMRETGGFGQPLHALYPQIRAVLAGELGPEMADLLAEPVVDRAHDRIDWYTEGDPERPPVVLSDLPEERRPPILARVLELVERGREVAERYAASGDSRRAQLGAMVRAALSMPAETEVFLVDERPVMIRWGFMPDRPWETPADSAHSPMAFPSATKLADPSHDVAMPEIAMPELAAMPEPGVEPSPLPESPPAPLPELLPESSPTPPREPVPSLAAPEPGLEPPLESQSASAAMEFDSSPEPKTAPDAGWLYVVVGSRYFWSVFALAVLLAASVAVWQGIGKPPRYPVVGEMPSVPASDADLDRVLTEARRAEVELRTRLEHLLAQLTERRDQCALPVAGADVTTAVSVDREPDGSGTVPARPTVAVAEGASPRESAMTDPVRGPAVGPEGEAPIADRVASPGLAPVASPPGAFRSPANAGLPPIEPESRPPPGMESTAVRTLEDVLVGRASVTAAPLRQPPPAETEPPAKTEPPDRVEPPVRAEPTAEERREFTSRLAAAGAATGEITATLLWNGSGDLDLVVRCPSGQQLDYRHPAACGGALDVDANAARASLSDRPVENAVWPAGRAAPGNYEIVVRYAPRKDEQNPRETPFQVRLIRGGQESVFKGAIRPNAMVSVTTFTVER